MSMTAQERTMAILSQIDEAARDVDHYEYGLPIYMDNPPEAMLVPIREVLEENARLRESVTWWQGVAEAKQEERDAALKEVGALRKALMSILAACPTATDVYMLQCMANQTGEQLDSLAEVRDRITAARELARIAIAAGTWKPTEEGR